MRLLLVDLIWLLLPMLVIADWNGDKALPWPDGGDSDFASNGSVQKERSKRDSGSAQLNFYRIVIYLFMLLYFVIILPARSLN